MNYTINVSDDILGKQQINKVYKQHNSTQDIMNTMVFDCLDNNIDNIIDYCMTSPFFAEYKFALLKNPAFLYSDNSIDYEDFNEKLIKYIENSNESTILIIYNCNNKIDERKKISKFLKTNTKYIQIDTPDTYVLNDLIKQKFNKYNNQIDKNAIELLIQQVGTNLSDMANEIDKLALYKPNTKITKEDIKEFASYNQDMSIFDLSNAIMEKNITKSLALYEDLIKEGLEPIQLTSLLASNFRIYLLANEYKSIGLNQDEIAKKLKIHPYRVKLALQSKFTLNNITRNLERLADLDYAIKSGKVNKYHGLKLFILNI